MRTAMLTLLSLCLLVCPAWGIDTEGIPPGRNFLTAYLDEANIHPPVALGRLTIFPISLNRADRLGGVLSMAGALAKNVLVIEEADEPQVRQAKFTNRSGSERIFLMSGEVLSGGKQNRTLATDALLGPKSTVVLPVYCVERGRWRGARGFARKTAVAPMAVRAKAAGGAAQTEIWDEVARASRRLGAADAAENLVAALEKSENVDRLTELRRRIRPKLPDNCAGVVVAQDGTIVAADLFLNPALFAKMREKVLNSYLSQYSAAELRRTARRGSTRPDQEKVKFYLRACYRARLEAGPRRGVGRIYNIRGAQYGYALAYEGRIVPVAESRLRAPRRRVQYMIHTALMQETVAVKPSPPRPPRPIPIIPRPRPIPLPRR